MRHVRTWARATRVFIVAAALLFVFPSVVRAACPALGIYRTPIVVTYEGLPLTNYFAILGLDTEAPISAGRMNPDAGDLRFADESCNELTYWIESGLNTTQTRIWVVLPSVVSGSSSQLSMYYGNSALSHPNDAAAIFGPGIAAVYPFGEAMGNVVSDPVGGFNLIKDEFLTWEMNPGPRPGLGSISNFAVSVALRADDSEPGRETGPSFGTGDFTVLSVARFNAPPPPFPPMPLGTFAGSWDLGAAPGWALSAVGGPVALQLADGSATCAAMGGAIVGEAWTMVGGRRAASTGVSVFQNGLPMPTTTCETIPGNVDGGVRLKLGNAGLGIAELPGSNDSAPLFGGVLSFTALYQGAVSDAAIAAVYASLLPPSHPLITFGSMTIAPVITSANQTTFTVGTPGSFTFTATGAPPPSITVEGALPAGVTIGEGAVLSGTPAPGTAGIYPLSVQANNDPPHFAGADVALDLVTQNFTLTVVGIAQTIEFAGPAGPQTAGTDVALVATASSGLTVTFASTTPTVCTVSGATATLLAGGACTIVASQPGDGGTYAAALDVTRSFDVAKRTQTIEFVGPGPQERGASVSLVATASSGLTVTFASTTASVCSVSGATASLLTGGTCTIVASQPGDGTYLAAADVTQSFEVTSTSLVPDPPVNISVSVDNAHVALRWTPAATGQAATMFLVEVGDAPGQTTVLTRLTREQVEIGVLPRGDYYLRVRALNQHGLSLPSEEVSTTVASTIEASAPPVAFNARVVENTVHLSWRPAAFGAPPETYILEVGSQHLADDVGRFVLPGNTTSLSVPNVPPGRYVLRVRARNGAGYTPPGPEILVHVGAPAGCDVAPRTPVMLTPVVAGHNVAVTWLEWPGERPSFVLEAGTAPGASNLLVADIGGLTGIGATVGDGTYAVRVTPRNTCGNGPESAEAILAVSGATPAAPTGLVATVAASTVTFTWTPPASGPLASRYVLEAGIAPGSTLVSFPVGSATTFVLPGAPPGSYVVRIRGVNAAGAGAASTEVVVIVP